MVKINEIQMLNYFEEISDFINENFTPSNPENANVKLTTEQLLVFLFRTFPDGCLSDYELCDILIAQGYKRFNYVLESAHEIEKGDSTIYQIQKTLTIGWCLKSPLDLKTEEVEEI